MQSIKSIKAFSLIEILVVISIFAIIGVLSTSSIFSTLRNSRKSDSLVRVRENVNYALGIIERQIRSAESVTCSSVTAQNLPYIAEGGVNTSFSLRIAGADRFIASGSARLTSNDITVTSANFACTATVNNPPSINISITAEDNTSQGAEKGSVTSQTEILLRNY